MGGLSRDLAKKIGAILGSRFAVLCGNNDKRLDLLARLVGVVLGEKGVKGGANARLGCAESKADTYGISGHGRRESKDDRTVYSVEELVGKCCVIVDPVRKSDSDDAELRSPLCFLGRRSSERSR